MASAHTSRHRSPFQKALAGLGNLSVLLSFLSLPWIPAAAQNHWGVIFGSIRGIIWHPSVPKKHPDFNGDGLADLAIGAPTVLNGGGAVYVAYGSSQPFVWPTNQQFSNGGGGQVDRFGAALAWGDFNKDGFDDLAIG